LDKKSTKIEVVDVDESNNFVVDKFFYLKSFEVPKIWLKYIDAYLGHHIDKEQDRSMQDLTNF
jgi:hypothetical protein